MQRKLISMVSLLSNIVFLSVISSDTGKFCCPSDCSNIVTLRVEFDSQLFAVGRRAQATEVKKPDAHEILQLSYTLEKVFLVTLDKGTRMMSLLPSLAQIYFRNFLV